MFLLGVLLGAAGLDAAVAGPPVRRSTSYDGSYSNIVSHPVQPWMNTNTVLLTAEAWIYCRDLLGFQALVARHFTTNLWFGLSGNRLRFYRSGGTFVDSDATLAVRRWTHVAVTYDGSNARFYVNGVAGGVKALASAGNNCTNSLSLGGQRDVVNASDTSAAGYAFNGFLDEVRLWTVVRSASAIAAGMDEEIRSGTGLLAVFDTGGDWNSVAATNGLTAGIPVQERESGFGILPRDLCIPRTTQSLQADGTVDLINEYRGAETLVLRSKLSATAPDALAYLMVSKNGLDQHLFVAVPDLPQSGSPYAPTVQVQADVNPTNGTGLALGDWECRLAQDGLQGGRVYGVNPPFFPDPTWLTWGQGVSNWQAATVSPYEFHQNYEFRIHGRHLNYFSNEVGLLVRHYDYDVLGDQLAGPRDALTNQTATYARATWCGAADAPTVWMTIYCSVSNLTAGVGASNRTVALYSGESELGGQLLVAYSTGPSGKLGFIRNIPRGEPIVLSFVPPANAVLLPPVLPADSHGLGLTTLGPTAVRIDYPAICSNCFGATIRDVEFRFAERGPVGVTGVAPTNLFAPVTVRTNPLRVVGGGTFTVSGSNLHAGVEVYLRGPGCSLIPPNLCTSDWVPAPVVSAAPDGSSLVAAIPSTLAGVESSVRPFQVVVGNPSYLTTGGNRWTYGPGISVGPPPWPLLNGFSFINDDDGPSVEEFEACYESSIFTPLGFRDPYYGLWAGVYLIMMDSLRGSCYGFSGASALMADGSLSRYAYDQPWADGVRGVRYANGYLGLAPCIIETNVFLENLCPPKPYRWTGFDLFQPYRSLNLWGRITSLAGAQTSAEAIGECLSQLGIPRPVGPRRGFAAGNPVHVLDRIRSAPSQYTLCVQKRDYGDGHCVTPYAVVDGLGLDAAASLPVVDTNKSLIKIYDNNHPGQERFIEVDRASITFRYNSGGDRVGVYEGSGLFYTSLSVYRGPRHALDPFSLGRYGVDYLRLLMSGASSASMEASGGGRAGWTPAGLSNSYDGSLTYVPVGLLPDGTGTPWDATMYFLPQTNAPATGSFLSAGSNVLLYAAMGWGDIAFGFRAANTGVTHAVDGIGLKPGDGLTSLGLRAAGPVTAFSAMTASRDSNGQSRVLLLDAGAGSVLPDLLLERDGLRDVRVRNRGASAITFRIALAGADAAGRVFDQVYGTAALPGHATLRLVFPAHVSSPTLVRELDTNNDGTPEEVESLTGAGQLRLGREGGLLALRWREAGFGGVLESSPRISPASWSPANTAVTTEGADRVARVAPGATGAVFRVRFPGTHCLALASQAAGPRPNPWSTNGFTLEALSAAGALLVQNTVTTRNGYSGLDVAAEVRVLPPAGSGAVTLEVFNPQGPLEVEAVGPLGAVLSSQVVAPSANGPQTVTLRGYRATLQFVRVKAGDKPALLRGVCAEPAAP